MSLVSIFVIKLVIVNVSKTIEFTLTLKNLEKLPELKEIVRISYLDMAQAHLKAMTKVNEKAVILIV